MNDNAVQISILRLYLNTSKLIGSKYPHLADNPLTNESDPDTLPFLFPFPSFSHFNFIEFIQQFGPNAHSYPCLVLDFWWLRGFEGF